MSGLSVEEREKGHAWMLSAALQAEQALYMWREGLINEASYRGFIGVAVSIVATPGGRVWWASARTLIGDDISGLIDCELETRGEEALDWTQTFTHMSPGVLHSRRTDQRIAVPGAVSLQVQSETDLPVRAAFEARPNIRPTRACSGSIDDVIYSLERDRIRRRA